MTAMGIIAPPDSMRTLVHVFGEVWTEQQCRYARVELFDNPMQVLVYRRTGDFVRGRTKTIPPDLFGQSLVSALDDAIRISLEEMALQPLTISEALEAGERRRCDRRWRP